MTGLIDDAWRRELSECVRSGVDARDQVERTRKKLQTHEARDLGDLLVGVSVGVEAVDVGVADLGGCRKDRLRERDDRGDRGIARCALPREPDLARHDRRATRSVSQP
ncbi:MAG TPA: hypothetical protein VHJ39_07215 [Solirubrobacteraceae bacterium]|nr:hypothetical protein [Solirubrobacteraceae bacterium]